MEIRKNKKRNVRIGRLGALECRKKSGFFGGRRSRGARVSARGPGGARIFGAARSRRAQTEGGAQGAGPIQCGKRNGLPHVIIKKSSDSLAAALCFGPVARNIWPHPPHPQGLGGVGEGAEGGPPPGHLGVAGGF